MPIQINGADLATTLAPFATLIDSAWDGDLAMPPAAPVTRPQYGGFGARITGAPASSDARTLRVDVYLHATTPAALELAVAALIKACGGGATTVAPVSVTIGFVPSGGGNGRQFTGYLTPQTTIAREGPVGLATWAKVTLVFTCPDPRAYATTLTTVPLVLTGDKRTRPLTFGDVASPPVFTLPGPWISVTLYWEDSFDQVVTSLQLVAHAPFVASGETVIVDCADEVITHVDTLGNVTPVSGWYNDGEFFALDPAAKNGVASPAILTIPDGGALTGATVAYRLAWR